jgi:hypothetical protein
MKPLPLLLWALSTALSAQTALSAATPESNPSPSQRAMAPEQEAAAVILPFLDALANPPSGAAKAFRIRGTVESIGGIQLPSPPPEFDLALEPPARMRVRFPVSQSDLQAGRDGNKLWASPRELIQPLLGAAAATASPPSARPQLPAIRIPFAGSQLQLIPALLQVQAKGEAPFEGVPCRIMDVRVLPPLAQMLSPDLDKWAMRLWVNPRRQPARIGIQGPQGNAVFKIHHVDFQPALARETWTAPEDALEVPLSLLQSLWSRFGKPQP